MKKEYQKPGMYVESFALSQSIAADCGALHDSTLGHPTLTGKSVCGWDMGGTVVWSTEQTCKDLQIGVDVPWEGVCYNNPLGGNTIFNS